MKNNKILELQWIFKPIGGIATEIHASNIEFDATQKIAELMSELERRGSVLDPNFDEEFIFHT